MPLASKRRRLPLFLAAVLLLLTGAQWTLSASLHHALFVGGWLLFAVLAILSVHNPKKPGRRVVEGDPPRPAHMELGWFALGLYVLHAGVRIPGGELERLVAGLFVLVALSGVWGSARLEQKEPRKDYWLYLHTALVWGLLLAALVHGILCHAHGVLAKIFYGGAS